MTALGCRTMAPGLCLVREPHDLGVDLCFLWVQKLFSQTKPWMPLQTLQTQLQLELVACNKLLGQPCAGFWENRAGFQGRVVQDTLIVFLYIHPMVMEQLFWEQAVPFPFTSSLEMQNHRDDFIHTESTPAFKESEDWKRFPGSACPATAALHLMQGLEHGRGRGWFLGLLLLEVVK